MFCHQLSTQIFVSNSSDAAEWMFSRSLLTAIGDPGRVHSVPDRATLAVEDVVGSASFELGVSDQHVPLIPALGVP